MRIINQSHEIKTHLIGIACAKILYRIEQAGRTCYKSESKGDASTFVRKIIKSGHHSVIEHENITVKFITDRGVTHELVRHRLAAYSQESTRYCDYGGEDVVFIRPAWCDSFNNKDLNLVADPADIDWFLSMEAIEKFYKGLRKEGWSPQQARAVLPNSLKTEIVMTANLREWRHVLKLRTSQAAHPQIRELMIPLLKELQEYLPEIFEDI